jgi:hypothetical protein
MMELLTFFALAAEPRSCAVTVPAVSPRSQQSYCGTLLGAPEVFSRFRRQSWYDLDASARLSIQQAADAALKAPYWSQVF